MNAFITGSGILTITKNRITQSYVLALQPEDYGDVILAKVCEHELSVGDWIYINGIKNTIVECLCEEEEDMRDHLWFCTEATPISDFAFKHVPKEKTYSQADMECTHRARIELSKENARLVSEKLRMQICIEANNEILEKTAYELEEVNGEVPGWMKKITDLERENDMLKVRNYNLEFGDKLVCDCEAVIWVAKDNYDIVTCPICGSSVKKES